MLVALLLLLLLLLPPPVPGAGSLRPSSRSTPAVEAESTQLSCIGADVGVEAAEAEGVTAAPAGFILAAAALLLLLLPPPLLLPVPAVSAL